MAEARQYGVDRMVLTRLVNDAALDNEAARLGLSTGDAAVRAQVMATPAFHGADGKFDREAYTAALERIGLTPSDFEDLLRRESTRDLLAERVQAPATLPHRESLTVLDFLGETAQLRLAAPRREPAARAGPGPDRRRARRPSTTPTPPTATPAPRPGRSATPASPPRRSPPASRSPTTSSAPPTRPTSPSSRSPRSARSTASASAPPTRRRRPRPGSTPATIDFDALAAERGLKPDEIDQGIVAADALPPEARDAVFGAAGPGIVGPVATPLGPALYRINAIMAAKTTPFEEAKADLAKDRALAAAKKQIADDTAHIEDLIAGGATLEEIASETVHAARQRRAQQRDHAAASPTTRRSATPRSRPTSARRPTWSSSPAAAWRPCASTRSTRRR